MTTLFEEVEPMLRVLAALAVAAGVVGFYFGAQALFGLLMGALAVFGGGMLICCAVLLSAWLLLGAKRVSNLIESQNGYVLFGAYLGACAGSSCFFYLKVIL